jgi:plastocyanin
MNTLIPNQVSNEQTRNGAERPALTSAFLGTRTGQAGALFIGLDLSPQVQAWRIIMKRYTLSLLAALAAIAVIPFVAAQSPATVVRMTGDKSFEPKTITVKPGDTVVWKNVSDMVHTVTDIPAQAITKDDAALPANAKEFDSGLIQPGKDYSHTFTVPGTYKYFCVPHETVGMVGTVVVAK